MQKRDVNSIVEYFDMKSVHLKSELGQGVSIY